MSSLLQASLGYEIKLSTLPKGGLHNADIHGIDNKIP